MRELFFSSSCGWIVYVFKLCVAVSCIDYSYDPTKLLSNIVQVSALFFRFLLFLGGAT